MTMDTVETLEAPRAKYDELWRQERELREHINAKRRELTALSKARKRAADAVNSKLKENRQ
jgi:hypothetical protein